MAEGDELLTHKVGPLPIVAWVGGGAALVFLFIMMRKGSSNNASNLQTNQVSSLAPTEAEAFGTIEQQQQDVTNALTTLGNNQSYLGGSIGTLTGIVTQQGADNAAAFQNLVNGQQQIQQGQTAASDQATNYQNALLSNMLRYFQSLSGQVNTVNNNTVAYGANNISYLGDVYNAMLNQFGAMAQSNPAQYAALQAASGPIPAGDSPASWLYKFVGGQTVAYMRAHPEQYPGAYGNAYTAPT